MRITRLLWGLWATMIIAIMLRQQADTYMIVGLIVIPILIVLIDLHEEIVLLKEENKHQRKFVMDRYNVLQDRITDLSSQIEKRLVVDFADFARSNAEAESRISSYPTDRTPPRKVRKKKKKRAAAPKEVQAEIDLVADTLPADTPPADTPSVEDNKPR